MQEKNYLNSHKDYTEQELKGTISILDDETLSQSDLLAILGTASGRRFIRRIFRACNVFEFMPVGEASLYAWHEGRRSIGLSLYQQIFALGQNFINQLLNEERNNV